MYKVPVVTQGPKVEITHLDFAEVLQRIQCSKRAGLDLRTRHDILTNRSGLITLKTGGRDWDGYYTYWSEFAGHLNIKTTREVFKDYPRFPPYVEVQHSVGYFTSDSGNGLPGFESTLMAQTLYADLAVNLTNVDYDAPIVHMFEGFLAILGPALGLGTTFIGDERYSGHSDTLSHADAIEQTEWWWRAWNKYLGASHSIQSVCGAMHKDDIVLAVTTNTPIEKIGSCDLKDTAVGGWCGSCWKCCSTAYILWAYRGQLPFAVTKAGVDQMLAEWMDYRIKGTDRFRSLGLLDRVNNNTGKSVTAFANAVTPI